MMAGMGTSDVGGVAEEVGEEDPARVADAADRHEAGCEFWARPRRDLDEAARDATPIDASRLRKLGERHPGLACPVEVGGGVDVASEQVRVLEQRGLNGTQVDSDAALLALGQELQPALAGQRRDLATCDVCRGYSEPKVVVGLNHDRLR
jgi:hypothetical protein